MRTRRRLVSLLCAAATAASLTLTACVGADDGAGAPGTADAANPPSGGSPGAGGHDAGGGGQTGGGGGDPTGGSPVGGGGGDPTGGTPVGGGGGDPTGGSPVGGGGGDPTGGTPVGGGGGEPTGGTPVGGGGGDPTGGAPVGGGGGDPTGGTPVPPDPDAAVVSPDPDAAVVSPDPDAAVVPPDPDAALPPACEFPAPAGCPVLCTDAAGGCPTDIYTLRTDLPLDLDVAVRGVVIAVRRDPDNPARVSDLVVQVSPEAPEYRGAADSGLWVYLIDAPVPLPIADFAPGDLLDLRGRSQDYFGQHQLHNVRRVERLERDHPLPPFSVVAPQDVATGGPLADVLEATLIEVRSVSVIDVDPPVGEGDLAPIGEFMVTGGLRVNDFLHATPFPLAGVRYDRLSGVLRLGNADTKLEPRGPDDVARAQPVLVGFSPVSTRIDVGTTDVPRDGDGRRLTVALDAPAPPGGTLVGLSSANPNVLSVPGGVLVPAGFTEAQVQATAFLPSPGVALTAGLGGRFLDATVEVVQVIHEPRNLDLQVLPPVVGPGGRVDVSWVMDAPPPGGFEYTLTATPAGRVQGLLAGRLPEGEREGTVELAIPADAPAGPVDLALRQPGRPGVEWHVAFEIADVVDYTGLVINEINYDNPDLDTFEYVELYNGGPVALPITALRLEFINGADMMRYAQVNLDAAGNVLRSGEFLVVGTQGVLDVLPSGLPRLLLQGAIQNGPDGVRLIDAAAPALRIIDAVASEGAIVDCQEGNPTIGDGNGPNDESLNRCPDGLDRQDNFADFTNRAPTPGAFNACP
ncbi:lamin tail domain-containing protein [Myxococcota bacterium]|nr:lamin tail domain-containing protein [Myxococcota bacterium]